MYKKQYLLPFMLTRPTIFHYISGFIVSKTLSAASWHHYNIPKVIGEYKLKSEIRKTNGNDEYKVGTYSDKNTQYFIKTWQGRVKNYSYYALVNECIATDLLSKRLLKSMPDSSLRIPRVVHAYCEPHLFSIVFEYIEGQSLDLASLVERDRVLKIITTDLERLSEILSTEEKKRIPSHKRIYYSLLVLYYSFVVFINALTKLPLLLQLIRKAYHSLWSISKQPLTLTHRDLVSSNIILNNGFTYLVDWETVTLTFPLYDQALILTEYEDRSQIVKTWKPEVLFYRIFICLQLYAIEGDERYIRLLEGLTKHI